MTNSKRLNDLIDRARCTIDESLQTRVASQMLLFPRMLRALETVARDDILLQHEYKALHDAVNDFKIAVWRSNRNLPPEVSNERRVSIKDIGRALADINTILERIASTIERKKEEL